MISVIVPLLLEAALRALFAAVAVWAGLRILRIGNVVVQKAAWGLVLAAAIAMPLAPRWLGLPVSAALHLPTIQWNQSTVSEPAPSPAIAQVSTPVAHEPATPMLQSTAVEPTGVPLSSAPGADRYPAPAISSGEFTSAAQSEPEVAAYASAPFAAPEPHVARTIPSRVRPATIAWLLYLGVFTALLTRLLFGLASALRLWISAKPVTALNDSDPADSLRLRSSSRVASPVNIGSGIILPADYADWDEEKLRVVLAHERSHVRQGDFYLQLLAGLYASLFWFSPLGWWLKRKLNELSEAISDRAGLEEAASRSSYAQLLLEFAALPRPTLTGVAMARTSHLTQRIERLLNESTFRQAFAAGGRRALLAVLLVPVALIAATALVRVEAAAAPAPQAQAEPQEPTAGQSTPEQVTEPTPAAAPNPVSVPAQVSDPSPSPSPAPPPPPASPGDAGQAPMAPEPPDPANGAIAPMPPMPPMHVRVDPGDIRVHIDSEVRAEMAAARAEEHAFRGMHFSFDGEPYALIGDPGSKTRFNGEWDSDGNRKEEIEKARKVAHGHFLWFRHDDKSYVVDDPAIVSQIEAMNKPMDDLGEQMRALGDQMRDLGAKQRAEGQKMREITVPTPDLSKEMAELNAAVASLKAKQGGTISQKDLGELQREFGRIQGELGALQGKIGAQQGAFGGEMGKFGGQMGELGGQMGKLGGQMGKIAHENHEKINGIIDESLKNGKAKPVE
jgi:beta-lactamase regulating signal transducer with metallopeptidase domain